MLSVAVTATPKFRKHIARMRAMLRLLADAAPKNSSVSVHLVGDAFMKKNVLSYEAPKTFPHPDSHAAPLGEIFLNPGYIASRGEDIDRMLAHGFLHLLGYDHKRKRDTINMEKAERALLRRIRGR